jgi:uncharacterized protein YjbJ (UPF0337 family)
VIAANAAGSRHREACALRYVSSAIPKEETIMSNESQKGEGKAQQLGGKIKAGIGRIVGDDVMEAEGRAKEAEGVAREEGAKAAERAKGAVEKAVGAVKNRVGHVIDNEKMAAEGKIKELKGEARERHNR